jgi:hypothetical protein
VEPVAAAAGRLFLRGGVCGQRVPDEHHSGGVPLPRVPLLPL